jgi:hypothetical protein
MITAASRGRAGPAIGTDIAPHAVRMIKESPRLALILVLLAAANCAPRTNPAQASALEASYEQGRRVFYDSVKKGALGTRFLTPEDRNDLGVAEKSYPGLYEQLMDFYPYAARDINPRASRPQVSFVVLAKRLAAEFLQFIPRDSPAPGISPLRSAVLTTGYMARKNVPKFRRLARFMSGPVKGQWGLDELNIPQAHGLSRGNGVRIAIIDTGLDPTLKDIKRRVVAFKDFLAGERPFWGKALFPYDWSGHGTSMASLISWVAPGSDLLVTRVFDQESMGDIPGGWWTFNLLEAGIAWALDQGADVINISAAVWRDVARMRDLVRLCWERNVILVASVGNVQEKTESGQVFYPAAYPCVIAVGGVDRESGRLAVWKHSAPCECIDVVAPAASIWVEMPSYLERRNFPRRAFGNSLATAMVSGTAALVLAAMDPEARRALRLRPGALSDAVHRILCETASNEKLGLAEFNPNSGHGLIDPVKAVNAAREMRFP